MIAFILQSRLARWIGAAVMGALAILTFGAIKRREGVTSERAREAARDAADFAETTKEVSHEQADTGPADDIRRRMRERAERKP